MSGWKRTVDSRGGASEDDGVTSGEETSSALLRNRACCAESVRLLRGLSDVIGGRPDTSAVETATCAFSDISTPSGVGT